MLRFFGCRRGCVVIGCAPPWVWGDRLCFLCCCLQTFAVQICRYAMRVFMLPLVGRRVNGKLTSLDLLAYDTVALKWASAFCENLVLPVAPLRAG